MLQPGNSGDPTLAIAETITQRGIRYATAKRFAPPEIAPFNQGSPDGERGPICPQAPSKLAFLTGVQQQLQMSEDCLTLSIARPAADGPHPVLVWIHGGAYVAGGGDLPWYDGARISAEQKLVVVSVTYRLGAFGYLRLPGASGPSNGLMDQMTALRWVRQHISAFGGDPDNVTVAGQSAGAHSIWAMMAWGESRTLFDRAVLMSSPALPLQSEAAAHATAAEFLRMLDRDPLSATAAELVQAQAALPPVPITNLRWAPIAPPEGHKVAEPVDLIAGWTRHDAFPFALMTEGNALAARLKGAALTRRLFNRGAQSIVDGARSAGGRAWLYRLDFSPTRALRAGHCIDLPLILGDEAAWGQMPLIAGLPWHEVHAAGRSMRTMIGSFARTGTPSDEAGRPWPPAHRPRRLP